jgi:hypothetical protein
MTATEVLRELRAIREDVEWLEQMALAGRTVPMDAAEHQRVKRICGEMLTMLERLRKAVER